MDFEQVYEEFVRVHTAQGNVRVADRDEQGKRHAEKLFLENVWWPEFHNFEYLYPEYEVRDYKEGTRYIDFAYIRRYFRIAIEIDGIGPHWRNITSEQFADHCQRQNDLMIDDWHVLRFAYQDVKVRPRICQQTVQQLIGRLTGESVGIPSSMKVVEKEILRLAFGSTRAITANDVIARCHFSRHTASKYLKLLVEADWLEPIGLERTVAYRIHTSRTHTRL